MRVRLTDKFHAETEQAVQNGEQAGNPPHGTDAGRIDPENGKQGQTFQPGLI